MKKMISILLVLSALIAIPISASAATFTRVSGTITSVAEDKSYIEAKLSTGASFIFRVDSASTFISGTNGDVIAISSVNTGDTFIAWHVEATTASIPAQSYLHTMIVTAAGSESYAHFITVKSVRYDNADVVLTNDAGNLLITVKGDTSVKQFAANGYADSSAQYIYPKAEIVTWYETVAQSEPAQTTATRVIVLYDGKAAVAPAATPTPAPTVKPAATPAATPTPTLNPGAKPPQTGDGASFIGFVALGLAALGTISVIAVLKNKKES